jgi:hypothetical protein
MLLQDISVLSSLEDLLHCMSMLYWSIIGMNHQQFVQFMVGKATYQLKIQCVGLFHRLYSCSTLKVKWMPTRNYFGWIKRFVCPSSSSSARMIRKMILNAKYKNEPSRKKLMKMVIGGDARILNMGWTIFSALSWLNAQLMYSCLKSWMPFLEWQVWSGHPLFCTSFQVQS